MAQTEVMSPSQAAFRLHNRRSLLTSLAVTARRKPLGVIAVLMILAMLVAAMAAPVIAPYDPIRILRSPGGMAMKPPMSIGERLAGRPDGPDVILGTDEKGRDIFSRIVWGTRVSLAVAVVSVFIGTLIGASVGVVSGYFGGATDMVMQRIVDGLQAFPAILLAMSIVAVLGPSMENLFVALAVIIAPGQSRVVRGAVLNIKQNMYIEAARALGASSMRIMWHHILPNVTAPIIILISVALGNAILTESSLSFLGLGAPPPAPSWGNMMGGTGTRDKLEIAPWMAIWPGLAISMAVYAFNLLGDTLRDILDPRMRGR
ncbi:MAG: ABC transporter permease [Chloroflexi bacterium]|nr:ABC transporter permease [Chloroflexota bacterium]